MAEFYKMNPSKWDNGTAELTLEQEAAYLRIVNAINKADEPCPARPAVLAGLFRCNTQRAKRLLQDLIDAEKVWVEDGKIYNEHAMSDVQDRSELRVTRQRVGKLGGTQKQLNKINALKNNETELANGSAREEKIRVEAEAYASGADAPDPAEVFFGPCLDFLKRQGVAEKQARSLLGKWRKLHGDEPTLMALRRCWKEGASEPVAFCEGILRANGKAKGKADERFNRVIDLAAGVAGRAEGRSAMDSDPGEGADAARVAGRNVGS